MKILVTDAQELAGLGAIRSLGRAGHRVTAGFPDTAALPAAVFSRFNAQHVAYPDPWTNLYRFGDWLQRYAREYDAVLPVSEASLAAATGLAGIDAIVPPAGSLPFILSKRAATGKALETGLLCPKTAFDRTAALAIAPPVIVKTDNRLAPDGQYRKGEIRLVESRDRLTELLEHLERQGYAWIVQEVVPGCGAGAFLLRWGDRVHLSFAHRRLHEVPFWGGWSSLRQGVLDPDLVESAGRLLAAIDFEGAGMVEFRLSGGKPYFIEINGRLWGSLALALHSKADFPKALVECYFHGQPVQPLPQPKHGIYCRNLFPGEVSYLASVVRGKGAVHGVERPGKLGALAGFFVPPPGTRGDFFWWTDPLPGIRQGLAAVRSIARSLAGKIAGKRKRLKTGALAVGFQTECAGRTPVFDPAGRILFLCYGNICRSAFAAAYWNRKHSLPQAVSAGFYPESDRQSPLRVTQFASTWGVNLTDHRSAVVSPLDIQLATVIFVMDRWNLADLLARFPEARAKTWFLGAIVDRWEIEDPYCLEDEKAAASFATIARAIDAYGIGFAVPPTEDLPLATVA